MYKEIYRTYDSVKSVENAKDQEAVFKSVLNAYDLFCSQVLMAKLTDVGKMIFWVGISVGAGIFLSNWASYLLYAFAGIVAYKYIVDLLVVSSLEKSFEFYARKYFNYEVYRESMTYLLKKYAPKADGSNYLLNISKLELYHHNSGVTVVDVKKNESQCNLCFTRYKQENGIA